MQKARVAFWPKQPRHWVFFCLLLAVLDLVIVV